jgi:cell division protein FtsB
VSSRRKRPRAKRAARARRRQRSGARRLVALALLVLLALLYAGPLRSYYNKRGLVDRQRAQVEQLRSQESRLERQVKYAATREAVEREARRLFYVKPGEHLYVVKGIQNWQQARARQRK